MEQEIERIINRQQARLLDFINPVNPPEIIKDAIKKYFNFAKEDLINLVKGVGYGNKRQDKSDN